MPQQSIPFDLFWETVQVFIPDLERKLRAM